MYFENLISSLFSLSAVLVLKGGISYVSVVTIEQYYYMTYYFTSRTKVIKKWLKKYIVPVMIFDFIAVVLCIVFTYLEPDKKRVFDTLVNIQNRYILYFVLELIICTLSYFQIKRRLVLIFSCTFIALNSLFFRAEFISIAFLI